METQAEPKEAPKPDNRTPRERVKQNIKDQLMAMEHENIGEAEAEATSEPAVTVLEAQAEADGAEH